MQWEKAKDIEERITKILKTNIFPNVCGTVTALRGFGSTSRAIARIWSFPRPWQLALSLPPQYIIEVISERFDKLNETEKDKVIIHELMHIPKGFSGALVAHHNRGRRINSKNVDLMFSLYAGHAGAKR